MYIIIGQSADSTDKIVCKKFNEIYLSYVIIIATTTICYVMRMGTLSLLFHAISMKLVLNSFNLYFAQIQGSVLPLERLLLITKIFYMV